MNERILRRLACFVPNSVSYYRKLGFVALVLICILLFFLYQKLKPSEAQLKAAIHQLQDEYGVRVHYVYDPKLFFSESDQLPPVSAKGSQIGVSHAKSILPVIRQFLSEYSAGIIRKNLTDIYLVGTLEFYGKRYGGSYAASSIYITTRGKWLRYSDSSLVRLLHAEFSSILFHNYKFPKEAWEAINQPTWRYKGSGFDMLGRNDLHQQTADLLRDGFLENFSQSELENDFNTFVAWIFTRPDHLCALTQRFERIRKKYFLVVEFYEVIDAGIRVAKCSSIREAQLLPRRTDRRNFFRNSPVGTRQLLDLSNNQPGSGSPIRRQVKRQRYSVEINFFISLRSTRLVCDL